MPGERHSNARKWIGGGFAALAVAAALALGACDQSPTSPLSGSPTMTLLLKDAPGEVAHAWVSVSEVYLQGSEGSDASRGGRTVLLDQPTGLIDLTELADSTVTLVETKAVTPGTYSQLRFVIDGAVLETTDGMVYSLNGAVPPDDAEVTGELKCPSCAQSGLKVNLPGGSLDLAEGETIVTLDFSVDESFGHVAGGSGMWVMHPVIHTSTVEPGPAVASGAIAGAVSVADSVEFPDCDGATRTIQDFVPTATASIDGSDSTATAMVAEDSTYVMSDLPPARWGLGYQEKVGFSSGDTLIFAAEPSADSVDVTAGDTATADFEILNATCQAASSSG
ncbi:MAG TPA: DUF4382 domain-containing protein [Gemmatimonadota bacterium]|nr:DUF4382 domain-containing protein [Gemmatimonadota bacterium]